MRRSRAARPLVAVAAGALLALAGCSPLGGTGTTAAGGARPARTGTPAWPAATPRSGLAKGLVLPLEAYMEPYADTVVIQQAVDRLAAQCMKRYGYTYTPPARGLTPPPSSDDANMTRRYGITDRDLAAKYGYFLGDSDRTPPPAPRLTSAETAVLTGRLAVAPGAKKAPERIDGKRVPHNGCLGEAIREVGPRIDESLASRLDYESLRRSQSDPRVLAVVGTWSRCMKAKGYTVDSPLDAANLTPDTHHGQASQADITTALTDIDCKRRTGLVKTWYTVESAIQRQQIEQNQLPLGQLKDRIAAEVKAATAVLGRNP
ncbi:hypothetical protein KEF29_06475 [Streptomyces tuirus]|uniref:Lipoprotein n=1 Tax=Streptomyces tuirus TaxID=68278 RepID=A0A941F952_9ACTN|nr:hypothetical protein [Streptomyces tuirus]